MLQRDVPVYVEAIGQTRGAEEVEVRALVEENAYPKEKLDTAVALVKAGRANVEAARAALTSAELNLSYTKIVSYTDAAALMLANLDRGNTMSRHRVGLALPVGMRGRKSRWSAKVNPHTT